MEKNIVINKISELSSESLYQCDQPNLIFSSFERIESLRGAFLSEIRGGCRFFLVEGETNSIAQHHDVRRPQSSYGFFYRCSPHVDTYTGEPRGSRCQGSREILSLFHF